IEIIIAIILGIVVGIFTGLFPGIHINLVGTFLVTLSSSFSNHSFMIYLVVFISSLAIAHTFIDFIPSIFLGCPDTDTELAVLPGHEMLKQGKGHEAVMRTAYGGLSGVILLVLLFLPLSFLLSKTYPTIQKVIPYILILVCIIMIFSEKNKLQAFLVMIMTGVLGYLVLDLNLKEPLLPLLSGLFGSSMLLLSIKQKTKIPKQKTNFKKIKLKNMMRPLSGAIIASPFCGFLPGLGGGQAAVIGNQISRTNEKDFLILLGIVNVFVMGLSFVSLYSISRTRTGAAAAVQSLLGQVTFQSLILIIIVCLISGIISFFLTKKLSILFIKYIEKIDYNKLSKWTILFLSVLILIISGILGLFVFGISTLVGLYCIQLNVKKTQMMGCLLIPTILLYLL
ncbi:MAG TPA: tripartite tricarboxylate transporter permease, partial [Candidatus Pacearchaeota archaeon]|nr:tripartite tricarboxylate transporter permease [Candidatus Pacearchaeota archaeon]HQF82615.1 tripartite tricarboxylate transporter permease [Candidatus Pacearchaeota archaeon]HQI58082.1 tripartite tricarboxylate transporter permease [Candidatus Pacearchaeota archaeon]HQJ58184.1 tripartite tricarboxylate transporter permease [Candidatus Pacearchaeota archaeon]